MNLFIAIEIEPYLATPNKWEKKKGKKERKKKKEKDRILSAHDQPKKKPYLFMHPFTD